RVGPRWPDHPAGGAGSAPGVRRVGRSRGDGERSHRLPWRDHVLPARCRYREAAARRRGIADDGVEAEGTRNVEGIELAYQATSTRGGVMTVRFATTRGMPHSAFITWVAGLEAVFQVCGVHGTVSAPEPIDP